MKTDDWLIICYSILLFLGTGGSVQSEFNRSDRVDHIPFHLLIWRDVQGHGHEIERHDKRCSGKHI